MGTSVRPSSEVQSARAHVSQVRENMDTRVQSAGRLKTAIEHIELNKNNGYFERSGASIKTLVEKTSNLTQAIGVLDQNNIDSGTCKLTRKVPGRLWGTRQVKKEVSIRDANNEIRAVVEDPVVVAGLRSLGIIPQPKAPLFTLPERPSAKTVAKAAGFTAAAASIGAGVYYRAEIGSGIAAAYQASPQFVQDAGTFISTKAAAGLQLVKDNMPTEVPGLETAKKFVTENYKMLAEKMPIGLDDVQKFVGDNKVAVGVGSAAIVALGAGVAIYKHRKNKQAQAAAAQNAAPAPVVVDNQKKI